jgi:DNA-binding Lrp family transcriptional regulator
MGTFDLLDRRLLFELDGNSRQSYADLARKLGQGRDRIKYRIERFLGEGIISSFITFPNHAKLGYSIYKSYIRFTSDNKRAASLIQTLKRHPKVYWIALCDGSWDMMFSVVASEPRDFYLIHQKLTSEYNDIILGFSIYTVVDIEIFQRSYLTGKAGRVTRLGGAMSYTQPDALDLRLMELMFGNARMPLSEIADTLDSTPAIIDNRLGKLEKSGAIQSYGIALNLSALGMIFLKSQLFLRDHQEEALTDFEQYCRKSPNITYYIQQLGDAMNEIEIEVHDYGEYHKIMDQIRLKFSGLIRNYNTILLRKEFYKWVPQGSHLTAGQTGRG